MDLWKSGEIPAFNLYLLTLAVIISFVLLSKCGIAAFQFLAFKLSGVPDNAHALWGALKL